MDRRVWSRFRAERAAPWRTTRASLIARAGALLLTGALSSCAGHGAALSDADMSAIQRVALHELFSEREHARVLVVWSDSSDAGPVLASLDETPASTVAASSALPQVRVSRDDVHALFRDHPDGWAALFERHPGAAGLVEVGRVQPGADPRTATLVIGRSCGEHCRMAWRVAARRDASPEWRVPAVERLEVE